MVLKKNLFFALVASSILAVVSIWALVQYSQYRPPKGGDFTLSFNGQPWRLSENKKAAYALYFGYTACPDVCPFSMATAGKAFRKLSSEENEKIQFVFVNVDIEHQTNENVSVYARQFFDDFKGLTGTKSEVDKVVNQFGASYVVEKDPDSYLGYSIAHTDKIFLLDQGGYIRAEVPHARDADELVKKIREVLK